MQSGLGAAELKILIRLRALVPLGPEPNVGKREVCERAKACLGNDLSQVYSFCRSCKRRIRWKGPRQDSSESTGTFLVLNEGLTAGSSRH